MEMIVAITTDAQGASVVSARELHEKLEAKTKFADWIKGRIIKYGFRQDTDYIEVEGFSENSEKGGRPGVDYALTLDMAKELCMVERNEKGRQVRQFFIECEKQLRTVIAAPALTTEQVLLQQAHRLVDQQNQIDQLRQEMTQFMAGAKPSRPTRRPALVPPHQKQTLLSPSGLRQSVVQRVNEYCGYHNASQQETYHYLYNRMLDVYGVNVRRLARQPNDSLLDSVERYGHLDRLYSLVMAELAYPEEVSIHPY